MACVSFSLPRMFTAPKDPRLSRYVVRSRDYFALCLANQLSSRPSGAVFDPNGPKDWGIRLGFRNEYKDEESCVEPAEARLEMDDLRQNHLLVSTLCQNARPPPPTQK